MRTSTRTRTAAARIAVALAALGGLLLTSAPASAATSYIGSNSGGANVRTCGNTGCAAIGYLFNGAGVTMICWTDSQWVYPPSSDYASPRWFRSSTGVGVGYIHSSLVENQTSVGKC